MFNPIDDTVPSEDEIEDVVKHRKLGKAPGPSGIRNERVRDWLAAARREKEPNSEMWNVLVKLIQECWRTGELPQVMSYQILVLIPKAEQGKCPRIGLLEKPWKIIALIINQRLSGVQYHSALHGFCQGHGMGTCILEAKLAAQTAIRDHELLYQVILDFSNAYSTMSRERLLEVLKRYGVGDRALRLLCQFWKQEKIVARQAGMYGKPFRAGCGVTQGDPLSPTIFNIVIDAIVRVWSKRVQSSQADCSVSALFYADDGEVACYEAEEVHQGGYLNCVNNLG